MLHKSTGSGCASAEKGAHVEAEQLEDVLGDDAVALPLQRAGLQEGVDVVVPQQPGRLLLLAQQPQVLCAEPDTDESVLEPLHHASVACIIPLWTWLAHRSIAEGIRILQQCSDRTPRLMWASEDTWRQVTQGPAQLRTFLVAHPQHARRKVQGLSDSQLSDVVVNLHITSAPQDFVLHSGCALGCSSVRHERGLQNRKAAEGLLWTGHSADSPG